MGEDLIRENATEYIQPEDAKDVLQEHGYNFGNTEHTSAYNTNTLDGIAEVRTEEGETEEIHYQIGMFGTEAAAENLLDQGVIEVISWDGGYSNNRRKPTSDVVTSARLRDDEDARNFGEVFEEIRDGEVGEFDYGSGFARDADASAAVGVALQAIDRALKQSSQPFDYENGSLHTAPLSDENFEVDVARDAVDQAFQPKSFGQRVVEKLS